MVALGSGDFPRGCERFRTILARDSLRFAGWFGLGECLMTDSIVVPDPVSPSRWRFRGSYAAGIAAYIRALSLVPLAHVAYGGKAAVARLADKLHTESNRFRIGVAGAGSSRRFAAFASLQGDSITTVPWPIDEVLAGKRIPAAWRQARDASRKKLRELTAEWLSRYPDSPAAIEAHAWSLELAGEITSPTSSSTSALALVHRVRAIAAGRGQPVELGAWEVRLLLKSRRFTAARLLSDSLLTVTPSTSAEGIAQAGLAALTGRMYRAAELAGLFPATFYALPSGAPFEVSKPVAAAGQRLLAYVVSGAPAESIQAAAGRLELVVGREVEAPRQRRVLEALLFRPSLLAFPVMPAPPGELEITRIEAAIAKRDTAAARRSFAALGATRERTLSTVAPDHILLEARLLALIGDSAEARARLGTFLDDLTVLGSDLFESVAQAAALPHAMALFAALGGDVKSRGVDSSLAALWKYADVAPATKVRR
jgi:hypothetical protein